MPFDGMVEMISIEFELNRNLIRFDDIKSRTASLCDGAFQFGRIEGGVRMCEEELPDEPEDFPLVVVLRLRDAVEHPETLPPVVDKTGAFEISEMP
jgi:hypothetical protein